MWLDHYIYLKFKATDEFLKNLDDEEYTETNWNDISSQMKLPDGYEKRFKTGWHPSKIKNKKAVLPEVNSPQMDLFS